MVDLHCSITGGLRMITILLVTKIKPWIQKKNVHKFVVPFFFGLLLCQKISDRFVIFENVLCNILSACI